MPNTVSCPRCFRNVPWTDEGWNAAAQCCTDCAPRSTSSNEALPASGVRRGGIGVRVTGLDVPFGDLVLFMLELVLASIPAGLFLAALYFILAVLLGWI